MTRDEFLIELRIADDYVGDDEPFSRSAQRIADHDEDRRALITEYRAEIARLQAQLATAKGEVWRQVDMVYASDYTS